MAPSVGRLKRPLPKRAAFFPIPKPDEWSDEFEDRRVANLHTAVGFFEFATPPASGSNAASIPFAGSQVAGGGVIKGAAFSGTPGAKLAT